MAKTTALGSTDIGHFYILRQFYWTTLLKKY